MPDIFIVKILHFINIYLLATVSIARCTYKQISLIGVLLKLKLK